MSITFILTIMIILLCIGINTIHFGSNFEKVLRTGFDFTIPKTSEVILSIPVSEI